MKKRLLSLLTTGVVAATMLFGGSAAAFAADAGKTPAPEVTAKVEASMQSGYSFIMCHEPITVSSRTSLEYGYEDAEDYGAAGKVTALDVMLAMHEAYYGDSFTKDTKDNYFKAVSNQWGSLGIMKAFRLVNPDTTKVLSVGYNVNDKSASKATDEIIADGDRFDWFEYQDAANWSDIYVYFSKDKKATTTYSGLKNDPIDIEISGTVDYDKNNNYAPIVGGIANANIYLADQNTGRRLGNSIAKTDANGKATVKFDKAGTYYLTATRAAADGYITMPWCKVTVEGKEQTITAKSLTKAYSKNKKFSLNAKAEGKLSYDSSNKKVATIDGSGKVTIKGTGKTTITIKAAETDTCSAATKKITLTIKPKKAAGVAVTAKRKAIAVSWSKDAQASGYQIFSATNSKFTKGKKTVTVKSNKTTKKTVSKLKAKKTYYVKVRAYKTVSGKKVYGAYSAVKKIKTR